MLAGMVARPVTFTGTVESAGADDDVVARLKSAPIDREDVEGGSVPVSVIWKNATSVVPFAGGPASPRFPAAPRPGRERSRAGRDLLADRALGVVTFPSLAVPP